MNNPLKLLAIFLLSLIWQITLTAQEVITPLFNNPRVAGQKHPYGHSKKTANSTMLDLPIFDDFSRPTVVPNPDLWSDSYAFVNNNFCLNPVSIGVATLDALDAEGSIYANAAISPSTFVADQMTSQPIMLDYPVSDSIYLSFLYQPGGLCDRPEEGDSLMVDFFAPDSGQWVKVWAVPGSTVKPFQQVMIPVKDDRFLAEGFRFRFRNIASLPKNNDYLDMRSNVDYWHIDYVRLHNERFAADTLLRDVAYYSPLSSFLKNLTSLPWSHFEKAYNTVLYPFVSARYKNSDTITRNVTRSLTIYEPAYNESHIPGVPTAQDLPGNQDTVVDFGFIYPFKFNRGGSALFRFEAALRTDEFDPKVNDTVIHEQLFKDYYSYDDGTAEAGYGLRGAGTADGVVAMKYNSYQPDYLGGVYISFNQVYDSINLGYFFKLVVWDEFEGQPGSVIWEDVNDYKPIYLSSYPGFVKYEFSEPVPVNGTFFVGWRQYNKYILNVGLDLNNKPAPNVMYYNIGGTWQVSSAPGVLMLRPFIYRETTGIREEEQNFQPFQIFPNPARDQIHFQLPQSEAGAMLRIEIFDATGRMVRQALTSSNNMDVTDLIQGIYYIRAVSGSITYHSKLLINP